MEETVVTPETTQPAVTEATTPPVETPTKVKRTRRPKAVKPPKKPRIKAEFIFLKDEGDGKWSNMGVEGGNSYEGALKQLPTFAAGKYMIVRNYGTKTVVRGMVEKVTVE